MSRTVSAGCDASRAERAAVTAVFLSSGIGIGTWAASIPTFKAHLSLSNGSLSLVLLAFAAGAVLAMPLAGLLAPKLGLGRVTRLGAGVFAGLGLAGTGGCGLRHGGSAGIVGRRHKRFRK